jgi:hypothetical protein
VGHDFEVLGRSGADVTGLINAVGSGNTQYCNDYRVMALRGPLVMKSWGYDTSGYPVPNKVDTEEFAASGIFEDTGLDPTKFLDGHLQKPHTWVTAPIDLRLDRDRGVWVAGNSNATPTTSSTADQIVLISVTGSGILESCCLYNGFMRPLSINAADPCASTMDYEEVFVYHHCNLLEPPTCIMASFETSTDGTGCSPSGKIYRFLSIALPEAPNTPCDCCCPDNSEATVLRGTIIANCSTIEFDMLYSTGIYQTYQDCDGNPITELIPFSGVGGWVSEVITCTAQYPVLLRAYLLDFGAGLDSGYYFRTNYSSPTVTHTSTYYDDNGTLKALPAISGYSNSQDGSTDRILTDENNDIVFDSLDLRYRIFVRCAPDATDLTNAVIVFIPPTATTASGTNSDAQTLISIGSCGFNIGSLTSDSEFGDGSTCAFTVNDASGFSTYDLNPWKFHWYCMCPCAGGGYSIDTADGSKATPLDPEYCDIPHIKVRIEWD